MELDFVKWLRDQGGLSEDSRLEVGIGDDAALIRLDDPRLVVTTDLLVDGVHFLTSEHPPEQIGQKAMAVNLSDLAAMGSRPVGAVLSLAIPEEDSENRDSLEFAKRLVTGMLPYAREFDCPIIGGDTNRTAGPLIISITAFGKPASEKPLLRSGAQIDDIVLVTGELGGSLLGSHLDFRPRVQEAIQLAETGMIHAAMDITDGLSLDLVRMTKASGCGAVIEQAAVPVSAAAKEMAQTSGRSPLDHALSDGEDFELLLTVSKQTHEGWLQKSPCDCQLIPIGRIVEHGGLSLESPMGEIRPLQPKGYEH